MITTTITNTEVAYLVKRWALLQGKGVREKTEATVNHAKQCESPFETLCQPCVKKNQCSEEVQKSIDDILRKSPRMHLIITLQKLKKKKKKTVNITAYMQNISVLYFNAAMH